MMNIPPQERGCTYYNDNDHFCCSVLRKNIDNGNLPKGYVDERDIREVHATDFVGYQHIHLFAGIGGFPLGFQWAGVPQHIRILTGGFPCQDISNAGKRLGITGERSGLWSQMYRLICDVRPDYVCVENVSALLYPIRRKGYIEPAPISRVLGDLAECRYDAEWKMLSAEAFGAPHLRERVFIVAYHQGHHLEKPLLDTLPGRSPFQPGRVSAYNLPSHHWQTHQPPFIGVDDGVSNWVHRSRSLGNSIVPQIAEYIGRCIIAHHQDTSLTPGESQIDENEGDVA